jgi:hypothetical protein
MLRHLAATSRRAGSRALLRAFADDAAAGGAGAPDAGAESRKAFLDKIKPLLSSTSAPPSFPTDFAPKPKPGEAAGEAAAAAGVPDKLSFSCYLPHGQPMDREPVSVFERGGRRVCVRAQRRAGDVGVWPRGERGENKTRAAMRNRGGPFLFLGARCAGCQPRALAPAAPF